MNRATILAGVGGGLLALLLLAPATGTALGGLARARAEQAEAIAAAARPLRAPPPLVAPSARVEGEAAVTRVRTLAAQGGVLVEQAVATRADDGLVRVRLRLSGPDKAVVALIDRIERESPLIRLREWRAVALGGGGLRIEGEAVAAWR